MNEELLNKLIESESQNHENLTKMTMARLLEHLLS